MTSDLSRQAHDSSSSSPTVVSTRCEAALALGRKLTKELELDQSVDTLGRWMAHYIAQLIQSVERANDEERPAEMRACADAILNLWKHRYEMAGRRPFEKLEPILSAIESLDPDDSTPRYFRAIRGASDKVNEADETASWLKLADGLDYSARTLILYCLTQAAEAARDNSAEWVALAEAAGGDVRIELPIVRTFVNENNLLNAPEPDGLAREQIKGRISRLESFVEKAGAVLAVLKQRLQVLPEPD